MLINSNKKRSDKQVKEIMTEDDDVGDAIKLMEDMKLRRLIVCDQQKTPVGIVSLGDVAVKSRREKSAGDALKTISKPAVPEKQELFDFNRKRVDNLAVLSGVLAVPCTRNPL